MIIKKITAFLNKLEKKDKTYVSEMDSFLVKFDKKNPQRSASQKLEIEKHRNIFNRTRDERIKW